MSETQQSGIVLTPQDLKDIVSGAVATAIQESKKEAPPTARQQADIEAAQEERLTNAQGVREQQERKKVVQKLCNHRHTQKEGGGDHLVWVRDENMQSPGYIYCQACEVRVRPSGYGYEKLDPTAIFDTAKFNELWQEVADTGIIGA